MRKDGEPIPPVDRAQLTKEMQEVIERAKQATEKLKEEILHSEGDPGELQKRAWDTSVRIQTALAIEIRGICEKHDVPFQDWLKEE
ncbi:MAG TPA: hypothetical protein VLL05_03670 [Terriglobales bacterium]|nr:hypothetical protein [Terriglobales bacterium]